MVAVVVALVVVKLVSGTGDLTSGKKSVAASGTVTSAIANVPLSAFNAAGTVSGVQAPKALSGSALTADGKPRVLFIGGEFCPYCGAERWPLAVALSRFGTLHNLGQTFSSAHDVYPSTPTLSFHGASYTSSYLSFTGREAQSNKVVNGAYATLDPISAADQALWKQIANDGYPFLDIGGRWVSLNASYDPQLLHGLTQRKVAADLSNPNSTVGKTILASANLITASICTLTHNQPAAVCTSSGVTAAAGKLSNGS